MLRDFQVDLENRIFEAWRQPNVFNVMPVAPTGAGKTVLVGDIITKYDAPTCVMAHRMELNAQMALALNRERVMHSVIAPKPVIQQIIALEHETHGYSMYRYNSDVRVASVDSLGSYDKTDRWLTAVQLAVIDEGHHVTQGSKWATAIQLFPNARGLFPTAHCVRADGRGLGRSAAGLVDALVVGPSARELITRGFLTDYQLYCPPGDVNYEEVPIGASGEYSMPKLRAETHRSSRLVGDVVAHYLKLAPGKLGITFAVDIEEATKLVLAYRKAGVPAEVITAKTPINIRGQLMRQFRNKQLLQLVSVDTLGEGVDVPAVEVISLARRTASWQLFCQQIGRGLRVMVGKDIDARWGEFTDAERLAHIAASGKPHATIIDHVGNVPYHAQARGLPCSTQVYSLASAERRSRGNVDTIPLRVCVKCTKPYESIRVLCPYCGHEHVPAGRATPDQVDGDLALLSLEALAAMRGEVKRLDSPVHVPAGTSRPVEVSIVRRHHARFAAQRLLRHAMALWGAWRHRHEPNREAQRRFYFQFSVDVMTAQTLGEPEAQELETRIRADLAKHNIVEELI